MIPDELKMSYNSVESLLSADASTATKLLYSVFAVVTVVKKMAHLQVNDEQSASLFGHGGYRVVIFCEFSARGGC
jgi:hypothetical protein